VSINVDAESGVSGLIWPGDRVDVVLTQVSDKEDPAHRTMSETVLDNVRIIAIDQDIVHGVPANNATPGKDARRRRGDSRSRVDGSGKSTLVAEIQRWLGGEIDVLPCYFGTGDGPAAPLFRPIKAIALRVARHVRVKPRGASHGAISDRPPGPLYSMLFVIWALAVALEKRQKLVSAQRAAARGFVVVSDRYPQNEIADFNDGSLLHRVPQCPDWLRRFEASIYALAGRAAPDLVIKLHVGPETVTRREPDMSLAVIRNRIAKLNDLTFSSARILSIDATKPIAEVHRLAKRAVWDIL
jgi:thymidylate kinase